MKFLYALVAPSLLVVACAKKEPAPTPGPVVTAQAAPGRTESTPTTTSAEVKSVGPMRTLKKEDVPKDLGVKGKIEKVIGFTDKNGDNIVVFSRRDKSTKKDDEKLESANIEIKHALAGTPPRVLRTVTDKVESCEWDLSVEFRDAALEVTDLDGDGIGEITFAYSLNCASDMTPADLKLLTLENGDKYILRGQTKVDTVGGGNFVVDASFKDGPPAFLTHAKSSWTKVRAH